MMRHLCAAAIARCAGAAAPPAEAAPRPCDQLAAIRLPAIRVTEAAAARAAATGALVARKVVGGIVTRSRPLRSWQSAVDRGTGADLLSQPQPEPAAGVDGRHGGHNWSGSCM